jgi:3-phenylpropionate/trans-cinnamate dioxygenase ferredoxin subunit
MSLVVCGSSELPKGSMMTVDVDGKPILVGRTTDNSLFAVRNRCPHQGAALSGGRLEPLVSASGRDMVKFDDTFVIRCPWHRYEFNTANGVCPIDAARRVRVYEIREIDGQVVLPTL